MARIVAGAGSWGEILAPRAYHNDAGVRARTVAEDVARLCGETLATWTSDARLGVDFVRATGPASRTLETVIGADQWWVDYDGVTHIGSRPSSTPAAGSYEISDYQPSRRLAEMAFNDLAQLQIGAVLSERLDAPQTIREMTIDVSADRARIIAYVGDEEPKRGRVVELVEAIARRSASQRIWGLWRYRVSQMSVDRVELQAVSRAAGLPDILPISMKPGVAGAHADLAPGAEVYVQFVEGSPSMPVITAFAGRDGAGFVPTRLTLGSATSAPNAARMGDDVQVSIPIGAVLVASPSPPGFAPNAVAIPLSGNITSGSSKVGIG